MIYIRPRILIRCHYLAGDPNMNRSNTKLGGLESIDIVWGGITLLALLVSDHLSCWCLGMGEWSITIDNPSNPIPYVQHQLWSQPFVDTGSQGWQGSRPCPVWHLAALPGDNVVEATNIECETIIFIGMYGFIVANPMAGSSWGMVCSHLRWGTGRVF